MKVKYIIYIALLLLVAFLVYNKFYGSTAKLAKETGKKARNRGPVPVDVLVVKDTVFDSHIEITGTVDANEQVELISQTAGNITNINFKEGQRVKKGDLLVKVYDQDLQAQLKQVNYQIKLAQEQENRNQILLEKEAVSKEDYDISLSSLNSLKAQADMISAQIAKTEIRAPFSGTIGIRRVSPGGYLSPQTPVATLVDLDPAKLTFSVPERYLSLIKEGTKVNFTVESSHKTFTGKVYVVEPNIDATSRTVLVRALVPNPSNELKAGSFAKINLQLEQMPKTILVPTNCVVPSLKSSLVYMAKNGKAEERDITTGVRTDSVIQVVSGLQAGDSVVISGIIQMRKGAAIQVQNVIK